VPVSSRARRRSVRHLFVHAALILVTVVISVPSVWMLSTSIKAKADIQVSVPRLIPAAPTLRNYYHVLFETAVPTYLLNSFLVASGTAVGAVLLTSLAAYALSRFSFRGKSVYILLILTSQMFPGALFLTPLFIVLKNYHLINSRLGLVVAYATFALPFCTWLLKGYFDSIPVELEESALTEGANRAQVLYHVTMPLAAPGMAATVLFAFLLSWQEFLFAFTYIQSDRFRTLPPGVGLLYSFGLGAEFGDMMVISLVMTVPVVILFIFLQRYIVQGLTAGAVKG
jgi:ABC-type glycerol-3-phosphate transport system permease component